jgi:uncharacterized repeat protein (TIGR03803 family)
VRASLTITSTLPLVALGFGLVVAPPPASAVTYTIIYNFTNTKRDGAGPDSDLTKVGPYLYGTASVDFSKAGVIFRIKPSRSASVIHKFTRNTGDVTDSGLLAVGKTLYGTTKYGGSGGGCSSGYGGCGVLYTLTPPKSYTDLVNFQPSNGIPSGGLSTDGTTLYGAATGSYEGGDVGTVYSVTPSGTVSVIYNFKDNGTDGFSPFAAPTPLNGTLYGTTYEGGVHGVGTLYAIAPGGTETILHSFSGAGDGAYPAGQLLNVNGNFYGTTGGEYGNDNNGYGSVFEITPGGTYTVLYQFTGKSDGEYPNGDLAVLNGVIYGTTHAGGGKNSFGTVFSVTPGGVFKTIHSFKGADGSNPGGGLLADGKLLYGTTSSGGSIGYGTVFTIQP